MTVKVEDGTGVSGANAYEASAFVTAYLTDRNRETENLWSTALPAAQDGAVVAATDFIEQSYKLRFLGNKQFRDISAARGTLTLTANALDASIVTIDTVAYTFNTVLGGANSVLIGADTSTSITNLVNAIRATPNDAGVTYGIGTVVHPTVRGDEGIGDTMIAEATQKGTAGNGIVTTTDVVGASWSSPTLLGGGDVSEPQPLSFPRLNLLDNEGLTVSGIPDKLKFAMAEYAVRALGSTLMPDPIIDSTGRAVTGKKEVVGPIETDTRYEEGAAISYIIKPYPAADRLLSEYITGTGRVVRG